MGMLSQESLCTLIILHQINDSHGSDVTIFNKAY